jgi:putative thioredoxin
MSNNGSIIEVNASTFTQDVIERSKQRPVIVDFWAPWCGPCRMLSPTLEKVTNEAQGAFILAKINVDDNPYIAQQYGVQGIPAVKMFRDGKVVGEFVGARPEPQVREFIKTYAPAATDLALTAALALIEDGRLSEAEVALHNILAKRPDQAQAALELGKLMLKAGRGSEAEAAFKLIPDSAREAAAAEKLAPLARLIGDAPPSTEGLDALYHTAAQLAREQRYAEAMDTLLDMLRKNRNTRGGDAKQAMLAMFEYLGNDPLVNEYRRKLANVLF